MSFHPNNWFIAETHSDGAVQSWIFCFRTESAENYAEEFRRKEFEEFQNVIKQWIKYNEITCNILNTSKKWLKRIHVN